VVPLGKEEGWSRRGSATAATCPSPQAACTLAWISHVLIDAPLRHHIACLVTFIAIMILCILANSLFEIARSLLMQLPNASTDSMSTTNTSTNAITQVLLDLRDCTEVRYDFEQRALT